MPPLVADNWLGFAKEVVWGTAVAPAFFVPVTSISPEIAISRIVDSGKRGVAAKDYASYAGMRRAKVGFEGFFYDDIPARFIHAILGSDAIVGAGDPYTHTVKLADGTPSLTLTDYDAVTASERRYPGCLVSAVTLKFSRETGAFEYSFEAEGLVPAEAAKSVPAFSGTPMLGWQGSVAFADIANTDLEGAEITLKRTPQLVPGGTTQDPNRGFAGGDLEVTGKMSFYAADDTILGYYRNNTQPKVSLKVDRGVAPARSIEFLMNKCDIEKVDWDRSGQYVRWDATFRGLYNATDGGPLQVVVKNAVAVVF